MNPAAYFILLIYLGAGFSNGKGLGELLSPFNLYGLIFWLYIGFWIVIWLAVPNKKQCQELREKVKKEEGEFKVLCITNSLRANNIAFEKGGIWNQWFHQMQREKSILHKWGREIEQSEKRIAEEKKRIVTAYRLIEYRKRGLKNKQKEDEDEKIKEYEEVIKKSRETIGRCEEAIKEYTGKLEAHGYCHKINVQPLAPRTWDDVHEDIKKYGTML